MTFVYSIQFTFEVFLNLLLLQLNLYIRLKLNIVTAIYLNNSYC